MLTDEGNKKFGVVLIVVLFCLAVLVVFLAKEARDGRRAGATKLAKQYVSERSELYREQDECDTEDFCCIERSSLRRRILSLEFESDCYAKFGEATCESALLNLPEFDTAGII